MLLRLLGPNASLPDLDSARDRLFPAVHPPQRQRLAVDSRDATILIVKSSSWALVTFIALGACDEHAAAPVADAAHASAMPVDSAPIANPASVASVAKPPAAPPDSVACQHVLVAYRGAQKAPPAVVRSKAEALARATEVHAKAVAGTDMAELAAKFSDDQGSRERLGSAGKFKREAMVKPFSDAAFALEVGGVSAVVETPFGFHVIKRNQ